MIVLPLHFSTGLFQLPNFGAQLVLNILWSIIFFGWHEPGIAFAEIIFLWLAIAGSIVSFHRISRAAATVFSAATPLAATINK